jgi:hypothetical protein
MDTEAIIQNYIEPILVDTLGFQVANAVLTRATICYVSADGDEEQRYRALVHSICSDERFFDAWGAAEAVGQEKAWLDLMARISSSNTNLQVGGRC